MPTYPNSPQANLPRFPDAPISPVMAAYIAAQIANNPSIDSVPAVGTNYRVAAGIFAFKNVDTALFNRLDTNGVDGSQALVIQNGAA